MYHRAAYRIVLCVLIGLLAGCASDDKIDRPVFEAPETAVEYEIVLSGLPTEDMTALAEDALAVYRRQEDGAQSLAFLRRRAQADVDILQRLLRSRGYYQGEVAVEVTELRAPATDEDGDLVPGEATVTLTVTPGEPLILARHDFVVADASGTSPPLDAGELGSPVGREAVAAGIVTAETAAEARLRRAGFPYAETGNRRALADLGELTLEVDTPIDAGPAALFGPITFVGLEDVRERYLRTYIPWEEGATFDTKDLRDYQQALLGTDLFDSVLVSPPPEAPATPGPVPLPVTVTAEERPFRTVSVGARYSTDEGPALSGGYEHRNLFGENETITVEAEAGIELQQFGVGYREPQFQRPGQDLLASALVSREEDDAFDDLTGTLTAGLQRRLTPRWVVGAGGLVEASLIDDAGTETTAFLGGIPVFAAYDGSNDQLNPTEGGRFRLDLTPYGGLFDDEPVGFFLTDATGSTYFDITDEGKYVLAARGRIASILADDVSDVPQTRRLYAGGGGSVRGFAQRFVGPLDANNDPTGGLSALEAALEFRARLYGDLGGVVFVDAGSVSEEMFPDFNEGVQVAAGAGFRYYSPAGPIRVDVAVPVNPRDADDAFQLYFSIGQAF